MPAAIEEPITPTPQKLLPEAPCKHARTRGTLSTLLRHCRGDCTASPSGLDYRRCRSRLAAQPRCGRRNSETDGRNASTQHRHDAPTCVGNSPPTKAWPSSLRLAANPRCSPPGPPRPPKSWPLCSVCGQVSAASPGLAVARPRPLVSGGPPTHRHRPAQAEAAVLACAALAAAGGLPPKQLPQDALRAKS